MVQLWVFDVAFAFSIFIHEVGHALMAKLLRVPISKFRYGFGPLLFRLSVLEWRLVPVSGEVQTDKVMAPWKGVLIALAGVIMQWIVVVMAMVTGIAHLDVKFWAWVLGLAMVGVLNLVPVGTMDGAVALKWLKSSHGPPISR